MVEEKTIEWWACPYCHQKYQDEDDANECAKECCEPESAEEAGETTQYFCEMCQKEHKYHQDAADCEERHTKKADRHFEEYTRIQEFKKLEKAGNHPAQIKLVDEQWQY